MTGVTPDISSQGYHPKEPDTLSKGTLLVPRTTDSINLEPQKEGKGFETLVEVPVSTTPVGRITGPKPHRLHPDTIDHGTGEVYKVGRLDGGPGIDREKLFMGSKDLIKESISHQSFLWSMGE